MADDIVTRVAAFLESLDTNYVVLLIGVPGSGKSTFRERLRKTMGPKAPVIVSSDDFVSAYAETNRMNYDQAFKEYGERAVKIAKELSRTAAEERFSVVIDQTNPTRKSRSGKLAAFRDFTTIGIYFPIDMKVARERITLRGPKGASVKALDNIGKMFEAPTAGEFDHFFTNGS